MIFQKNETITLQITDMGEGGEGIGKTDGFTVFVKDTVIGDMVEVKLTKVMKRYAYGRLSRIISPSPYRTEPLCPVARQCGGCQLQFLAYEKQLSFKEEKVRNDMQRIGGFHDLEMEPPIGADNLYHYRNKAQFPVGTDKNGRIVTGFYAGRTHSIIENTDCVLGRPENSVILKNMISFMEEYHIKAYDEKTGQGLVRHILIRTAVSTGEIMVCLVINGESLPHSSTLIRRLCSIPGMKGILLNINRDRNNVILGRKEKLLWGSSYITDYIDDLAFRISAMSFFQVNSGQTPKLYGKALEYAGLTGRETVWDLYCGIGTISLFLARRARMVYGVEIVPAAVENAKKNAEINHIENAEFYLGKAEDVLPREYETNHVKADVIVVDPPRKGCEESLLKTMIAMAPERIVYVSCNSATLARDAAYLCENGYSVTKMAVIDQFVHTVHVETVVLLTRNT